jgi:hypothetical protein
MRTIAIIHPEGNYNNNPNLAGLIGMFVEAGYHVDLYSQRRSDIDQSAPCENVTVTLTTSEALFPNDVPVLLPSLASVEPSLSAARVAPTLPKPDLIIGVDRGIIEAAALATVWGIPVGLISYEILFADEISAELKEPEIAACRNIAFAVCQDFVRGLALCTENSIPEEKMLHIPVAGRGVRRVERTKAIHQALGLDPALRLVLYMGELSGTWNGIDEILASTIDWPAGWVLVLHHRYGNGTALDLIAKVLQGRRGNVVFSPFASLPIDKMGELLAAVDLGIAFYRPCYDHPLSGKNLSFIGMASGKFSTYLQHGVPVLINELGEMSAHVRNYELGGVVNHGSQIPVMLESIGAREDALDRERCYGFFSEHLDLNRRGQPLLEKITSLL